MSHDDLTAQASSLKQGIEKLDSEIATLEGTLSVVKADRLNMAQRLGSLERFLDSENIALPYSDKAGV